MEDINIRELKEEDLDQVVNLVLRLKKFNSEHDPLFTLSEKVEDRISEYLTNSIKLETRDTLVADFGGKIVGVIMCEIIDRRFYIPRKELRITEVYILPEYRKRGLGKRMIDTTIEKHRIDCCDVLTVEFPTENLLAHKFYEGRGMRSILSVYGKRLH